jgi:hypothetical protein
LQHGVLLAVGAGIGQPLLQGGAMGVQHAGDVVTHVPVKRPVRLHGLDRLQRQRGKRLAQQVNAKAVGELGVGHGQRLGHAPAGGLKCLHVGAPEKVATPQLCAKNPQKRISSWAICFASPFATPKKVF